MFELLPLFLNKKQNENTKYHGTFISLKSHLYSKKRGPIFLLFGSWSLVFISMFGLSQSFSNNSNLIILVDIQRLQENGKWILCVSNGIYILFKRNFIVAPHCFIKLFHLQQI